MYWLYLAFAAVSMAGYAHSQLISYRLGDASVVPAARIPVFFAAIAMGVDALATTLITADRPLAVKATGLPTGKARARSVME